MTVNGKTIGSSLIGQDFAKPEYLHRRPSAAGEKGYDASYSYASNYGATNQKLIDRVKTSVEQYRKENADYTGPIPVGRRDDVGQRPRSHISPANADIQATRIARARNVEVARVREIIAAIPKHRGSASSASRGSTSCR